MNDLIKTPLNGLQFIIAIVVAIFALGFIVCLVYNILDPRSSFKESITDTFESSNHWFAIGIFTVFALVFAFCFLSFFGFAYRDISHLFQKP